jgi:hypothetical protein
MWIGLTIGWILACVSLYVYLYSTATEAPGDQCFDCQLTECSQCPYETADVQKRAA